MPNSNSGGGETFDVAIPPGENYDKAEFRLWLPDGLGAVRGVLVVVHGSNLDSRAWLDQSSWGGLMERRGVGVHASFWRDIALRHGLALLGCRLTDKQHEDMFIEEYARVGGGSGQALLDALISLAAQSGRRELAEAPLVLWGISAGG